MYRGKKTERKRGTKGGKDLKIKTENYRILRILSYILFTELSLSPTPTPLSTAETVFLNF
jgi:hypothetical protein